MFRHTALFALRDGTTADEKLAMLRGLAFLRMECRAVVSGDYGDDLLGGSSVPAGYDVALHLDFEDAGGYAAYVADPVHVSVSAFNASLAVDGRTARVDWAYDGPPRNRRGHVRHCALFAWAPEADQGARARALDAARSLADARRVESILVAENVGADPRASGWLLDAHLAELEDARALVEGEQYSEAMEVVAVATLPERTARVTHVMRGG